MGASISNMVDQAGASGKGGSSPSPTKSSVVSLPPSVQTNWGQPAPLDGIDNGYFPTAPKPTQPRPMGKGGVQTNSATSGQPTMGAPNQYSNTVGQWDNTQQQPMSHKGGGKGKG